MVRSGSIHVCQIVYTGDRQVWTDCACRRVKWSSRVGVLVRSTDFVSLYHCIIVSLYHCIIVSLYQYWYVNIAPQQRSPLLVIHLLYMCQTEIVESPAERLNSYGFLIVAGHFFFLKKKNVGSCILSRFQIALPCASSPRCEPLKSPLSNRQISTRQRKTENDDCPSLIHLHLAQYSVVHARQQLGSIRLGAGKQCVPSRRSRPSK